MNKTEFKEIMDGLKSMYGDRIPNMTGFSRELWYQSLSDLDFETTKKAIVNHLKSSKFPPTVADIREQYNLMLSKSNEVLSKMEKYFEEMRNYYPGGSLDHNAEDVYFSMIFNREPVESRLDYAKDIRNNVIMTIKTCEKHPFSTLNMSLSECIKYVGDRL